MNSNSAKPSDRRSILLRLISYQYYLAESAAAAEREYRNEARRLKMQLLSTTGGPQEFGDLEAMIDQENRKFAERMKNAKKL